MLAILMKCLSLVVPFPGVFFTDKTVPDSKPVIIALLARMPSLHLPANGQGRSIGLLGELKMPD